MYSNTQKGSFKYHVTKKHQVRECSPATVSNHCSSLLYPAKFLHRESAPAYADVQVIKLIKQLRRQATVLQRQGEVERPHTKENLEALNRWLSWEQIVAACGLQRDYFEMAVNKGDKARECCDLVILAMYTLIPPSRGLEVRTLEINRDWQGFDPSRFKGRNVILLKEAEQVTLHFHNYKTSKFSGRDELTLRGDHELCRIHLDFVNNHHPLLASQSQDSGNVLLLRGKILHLSPRMAHLGNH